MDSFWEDQANAQTTFNTLNTLKKQVQTFEDIQHLIDDATVYAEMITKAEEPDIIKEVTELTSTIQSKLESLDIELTLSGKYDTYNCILSLSSGAGGTDAMDWTQMLYRMYTRWLDQNGFSYTIAEPDPAINEERIVHPRDLFGNRQ